MARPDSEANLSGGVEAAAAEADSAAHGAGIMVTDAASVADAAAVVGLAALIWGEATAESVDLVRALEHAGSVVLLASRGGAAQPELVGFALGFLGWEPGLHLHSHQVGVIPKERSTGVGFALKLAQRARCLAHGVGLMQWTYDPLLASNAKFNFARLGVQGTAFMEDFYGVMGDDINGTDRSDRFEVSWTLANPLPQRTSPPTHDSRVNLVLEASADGWPKRPAAPIRSGTGVAIPPDYAALRERGDPRAKAWREALGEVLIEAFAGGLRVVDFHSGHYVLGTGDE
jgi:predicted GNAT superfamily acetyltransferase